MKKKFLTFLSAAVILFSLTSLALSQIDRKLKDDLYSQIELFSYALTTIQADYVEELPPKDLIYGSLKGMLATLDPHSQFLTPDEYKDLKTETQGKFGGLGIEISIRDGLLTVVTPIEDTPAWKVGLKAGDRIVKIEDEITKDMTLGDAVKRLRGKAGTDINITVLRESEFKILEFTITREVIHIQDVKHTQILADKIGYIRLVEFREDSAQEIRKALDELITQGADGLILDLRNNPGGLLNVAIKITEEFLTEGKLIVSTKGRRFSQNTETFSENKDHYVDWPMVILINEGSASGSEILAGALKDNRRAIIVGTQSFGKGSVQSVIPMPDGSGLRLTTSKYFTPSGESIHGKGITPDIIVEYVDAQEEEEEDKEKDDNNVDEIFTNLELEDAEDPEKVKEEKRAAEVRERLLNDNQVQSAISVLRGIKVYRTFDDVAQDEVFIDAEL
jgi:carboxyl-terminal processing protease